MKSLMFIFLFAPSLALLTPNLGAISKAITQGDAAALAQFFDQDVEITILSEVDIYTKAEAKKVVQNFFAQYAPQTYSQVHQGTSKGEGGQYCIGNLEAGNKKFRVYIYLKKSGSQYWIQELRFEKQ
ncbi:MAG: DUF4783 domain-containing protein [Bacteroidota bacterium]